MSTLMLGLWGEEAHRRAGSSWWVPAAGLALVAVCSGVTRFAHWLSLRRGLSAGGPGWPLTRPWL